MGSPVEELVGRAFGGEHEQVALWSDPASGLRAILAIHDTSRGPALGGIRCRPYPDVAAALDDALGLSLAMTRKVCLAGLPAGGGKVVVDAHPGLDRPAAFQALGRFIEGLGGRLFTSADLGTDDADLEQVARHTSHVTRPRDHLGDLGLKTAEGVFACIGTCMDLIGKAEWSGLRVAIQGMGRIGFPLAVMAARAGAEVVACDTDTERLGNAVDALPMTTVDPREIHAVRCDVFAPCAAGRLLDRVAAERLRCRVVVGAANEPLADDTVGDLIHQRGILFAPDIITSAGAVVAGAKPALPGYEPPRNLSGLAKTLREILLESLATQVPPHRIANQRADQVWQDARRARARVQVG